MSHSKFIWYVKEYYFTGMEAFKNEELSGYEISIIVDATQEARQEDLTYKSLFGNNEEFSEAFFATINHYYYRYVELVKVFL